MQGTASAAFLREQAAKCRRLANALTDPSAVAALRKMANDYQDQAAKADHWSGQMPPPEQAV